MSKNLSEKNDLTSFVILEDDGKTQIKYIYHMSDIHIRNTQRHVEYNEVFKRTYKKIEQLMMEKPKKIQESLIVLTGDIMHTKTELSPEAIDIAYHFLKSLQDLATVILIPGNHDCNLSNRDRMDALSPIVENNKNFDKLFYLKQSGYYQYHNVVFGVTSIFDDNLMTASKIDKHKWNMIKQQNKFKIALYHGAVHGAMTDVGYRMNNDQLLVQDFKGYDFVMLGDIHKYQYMDKKETIAYAGSLIQQSHGESLDNHGFIEWNLIDGTSQLVPIKNDYGYCTVKIINGKICENIKIPKKPRIRFVLENTNQLEFQESMKVLGKKHQICEIQKESLFKTKMYPGKNNVGITKSNALATQETIIKSYLKKKFTDDKKINEIMELHKNIRDEIFKNKKDKTIDNIYDNAKNQKWKILKLEFTNMLSYGKKNVIDFQNYDPNKIIGIVAPNHYGKSAIIDIILFCLFDKFSRGDRRDIMNKNQKNMYCSLLFSIGSTKYLIERIGEKSAEKVSVAVNFFKISHDKKGSEKKEKLNGADKNATNRIINELVGDYKDYLMTCFCLQQSDVPNFIDTTQNKKKEYLNEILRLNIFEDCYKLANEKFNKMRAQLEILEKNVTSKSLDDIKNNIKITTIKINELQNKKKHFETFIIPELNFILDKVTPKHTLVKFNELNKYNIKSEADILKFIDVVQKKLQVYEKNNFPNNNILDEINFLKNQYQETLNNHDQENQKLISEHMDLDYLLSQKQMLIKQMVKIPDTFKLENIEKFQKENQDILNRIQIIDEKMLQNNPDNLCQKISKMEILKTEIKKLRTQLKPVSVSTNDLELLNDTNCEIKKIGNEIKPLMFDLLETKPIDEKKIQQITAVSEFRQEMAEIIKKNVQELLTYNFKINDDELCKKNDEMLEKIMKNDKKWLQNNEKWLIDNKILIDKKNPTPLIKNLLIKHDSLKKKFIEHNMNLLNKMQNTIISNKIVELETELDNLMEFKNMKQEFDNLVQEKHMLQEKLSYQNDKIEETKMYASYVEKNQQLEIELNELDIKIETVTQLQSIKQQEIHQLKKQIDDIQSKLDNNNKQNLEQEKLTYDLNLLKKYHIIHITHCQKTKYHEKWTNTKIKIESIVNSLDTELKKMEIDLQNYKSELGKYLDLRKEFDEKSKITNDHQSYVQLMNSNGLPYEMLKTYLPLIESDVNQILHSMVDFSLEFLFHNDDQQKTQKNKKIKTDPKIKTIKINICYEGSAPYNVQSASGFEKFIVNLAIRMTLCQISLSSKPNFLVIDEGWSCLDSENLANVDRIINYIKSQYEHIIVISHLEQLKNQADHIINIDKRKGYSYIKTQNTSSNNDTKIAIKI